MFNTPQNAPVYEPARGDHGHLICWKSLIAGTLISTLTFLILSALGAGIFGSLAEKAVEQESGGLALLSGSGLWLGFSVIVSLFTGSYFAVRVSRFVTGKVGIAHGFVIASIFFLLLLMQAGSVIGSLSSGIGKLAEGVGKGSANIASNPQVQDAINDALGSTQLKSDPKDVAQGLATRLLQGDVESAKSYFSYQTGMSRAEADAKVDQLQAKTKEATKMAGQKAASILADTGWALTMTFVVGLMAALLGGYYAAHANVEKPLGDRSARMN